MKIKENKVNKKVVIDLTRLLPGPLATYILAHLGFEVIKVEDLEGELTRYVPPMGKKYSAVFEFLNAGKKSITLNLKKGREIFLNLVSKADIVVEGFRPGVLDKLGIGFDEMKKVQPKIILCSISGYGQTGKYRLKSGHDINYISLAGIQSLMPNTYHIPPVQIADISGALFGVISILFSLLTGGPKYIDCSMVESSLFFAVESLSKFLAGYNPTPGKEILTGGIISYQIYKTKDGRYISIGALEPKFWKNLINALNLDIEEFHFSPASEENPAYQKLKSKIESMTSEEIEKTFSEWDIPYEFVRDFKEMIEDEHIKEREIFYDIGYKIMRLPFLINGLAFKVNTPAPQLGEHTKEILLSLGYSEKEIENMKEKGIC